MRELSTATGELRNRCDALSTLLPNLPSSRNRAQDLDAILQNARVQGAGAKKNWPDDSLYERFKDAAEVVRAEVKSAQRFLEFDTSAAQIDAEAGLHLLALAKEVSGRYENRKQEFAWLDFSDLLIRAEKLLTDPTHAELQQRLASNLQLLLVDECQDTDPLQVELIKALCGKQHQNGKLFFVGDYKQSIYRFRGADPSVFRRLQQETPPAGQMPLSMNFRSQPAILHFVNALFCEALSIDNDSALAYQPLRPERKQITPTPAVEFLWAISQDQKTQAGAKDAARGKRRILSPGAFDRCSIARKQSLASGNPIEPGRRGRSSSAISPFCFVPFPTCNIMKSDCSTTASIIISWGATHFMLSRKFTTSRICCAPWPASPTRSAWPACCAARCSR